MLAGCTSAAQRRLAHGGTAAELQRLHDEGWLAAFRQSRCRPLHRDEVLPEPPPRSADDVRADEEREAELQGEFQEQAVALAESSTVGGPLEPHVLEELASEQPRGAERTPECRAAALRLQSVQQDYRSSSGEELMRANEAIDDLAPGMESVSDTCPLDDTSLFGAELAVARFLNATELHGGAPFGYAAQSCSLATLAGPLPVRVEASEEETGSGGFDHFALDGVVQRCTYGVEGHDDGCMRETMRSECDASCVPGQDLCCSRPYAEYVSREAGTVTIVIALSRAAMGCGSTGLRVYHLKRDGAGWRVLREEIIGYGNHGV